MSVTTGGVGLVVLMALALGPSVATAQAAGGPLILSPRSGEVLGAHPIRVRVRAGRHARVFRAQLNGHPIAKYFSRPSRRGVRTLQASATYGLRHGRNRLHVRVHRAHGQKRSEWARFRIRRNRPLAAAGHDVKVAAGDKVYLDGGRSRSQLSGAGLRKTGTGSRRRPGLHQDWDVIHAPEGAPPGAALNGARSSTPVLETTVPGRYRVKLTVKARDGTTGTDRVTVDADPPPAVPVDTMAFENGARLSGIKVGNTFYPPNPDAGGINGLPWAQLVALDRKTLEPIVPPPAKYTIGCNQLDCADAQHTLRDNLRLLGSKALAIVANPTPPAGDICEDVAWPVGLESALSQIGVSQTGFDQHYKTDSCGAISAIGAPGTPAGEGDWRSNTSLGGGRMKGWLLRNNHGYYTFAATDRVQYDTQASGSNASTNVIQLSSQTFSQALGGSQGGFQVVVADHQTLQGESYWFNTATGDDREGNLAGMFDTLKRANDAGNKLIVVASRGVPKVAYGEGPGWHQEDLNYFEEKVVDQLERAGATRTAAFRALDPSMSKDTSYTLIGLSGAGGGNGIEGVVEHTAASPVTAMSVAPLTGTMARTGPNYGFEPQAGTLVGGQAPSASAARDPSVAATQLNEVLVQPPSAWPEEDPTIFPDAAERARKQAAIKWIGQKIFNTDDFRGQYYTQIFSDTDWNAIAAKVQGLDYPRDPASAKPCPPLPAAPNFCPDDLVWAKGELAGVRTKPPTTGGEIGWLQNANHYMEALSAPFGASGLSQWAAFDDISKQINNEFAVDDDRQFKAVLQGAIDIDQGVASFIPGTQANPGEIVYGFVELISGTEDGTPFTEPFEVTAGKLGSELADRLSAQQGWIATKIPDIIAADYAKLKAVGSCSSVTADGWETCPFDHNDWEFTQADQDTAAKTILPTMKVWAWGTLLHHRYELYKLPPWWQTNINDPSSYTGRTFGETHIPFKGEPLSATVAKPLYRNAPDYGHTTECSHFNDNEPCTSSGDTWQIYALGFLTGEGSAFKPWQMNYPTGPKGEAITDVIFKPTSQGGLGADPESFYDRFWPETSTLDHYPQDSSPTGWCVGSHPCK
jgi:hypothetical protein